MYRETIEKSAANAQRIRDHAGEQPLGFAVGCMMAGAYVGIGIILIFVLGNLIDAAWCPLVMGATFGIALTLVIIAGAELYTGHTMYVTFGVKTGRLSIAQAATVLAQSWGGNLLGAVLLAWLFFVAGGGQLLPVESSLLHQVALAKSTAPASVLLAKGILCNWLVCLAVWMCMRVEGTGRFIAIWWCLLAFIACGFEHSIANMSIFALSWFGKHPVEFTLAGAGWNLFWVTLGNTIAGVVLMGLGYWYATPRARRPRVEPLPA